MKSPLIIGAGFGLAAAALLVAQTPNPVWTDAADGTLPPDFGIQGEYTGTFRDGPAGCQVIALGGGAFQAVLLPGGLPGAGWNGRDKILLHGQLADDGRSAAFTPATGDRRYLAGVPDEFSATRQFPPDGHEPCSATIADGKLTGKAEAGGALDMAKTERKSPTLGALPPEGARVLFDGSNKDAWKGGRLDEKTGWLHTDSKDIHSNDRFGAYTLHLEFLLPFRPAARGQGRGNSGFFQPDGAEIQVLDSFGLEGANNECGALYGIAAPKLNMCLPPLVWQTYDVDFDVDSDGKTFITVRHNGVVIHDRQPGHNRSPGNLQLQGHGNPLQYRNIWLVEKK